MKKYRDAIKLRRKNLTQLNARGKRIKYMEELDDEFGKGNYKYFSSLDV